MANIKLKNRTGEDVVYENIETIKLLDTNGNIQYYTKGQYTAEDLPQLYAPTGTTKTTSEDLKYYTITNPTAYNGIFPRVLQVITKEDEDTDYTVVAEISLSTTSLTSSIKVYSENFFKTVGANKPMMTRFIGDAFLPSEPYESSYTYSVGQFNYDLENVTIPDNNVQYFFSDDAFKFKFQLTTDEGYYLPKTIEITGVDFDGAEVQPATYSYSPNSGELYITECGIAKILNLIVHATQTYWLRNPQLSVGTDTKSSTLYSDYIDSRAETTNVICDGKIIASVVDDREGLIGYEVSDYSSVSGNTYKLLLASAYSYKTAELKLNMSSAGQVKLYIYCNHGISQYDRYTYIKVSKVDAVLKKDYYYWQNEDSLFYTTYSETGKSSTKSATLTFDVPIGEHTIEIIFATKQLYSSTSCNAQFRVETIVPEQPNYDMSEYFNDYGTYSLSAQSVAEGCDSSDIVEVGTITFNPVISNEGTIISVTNAVPENVSAFNLYVNGTMEDTISYNSTTGWSVDLLNYYNDGSDYTVYVEAISDSTITDNQSNTLTITATATTTE